ncbi:MAG TPA: hypothetical protein VK356_05890, partial [Thermomicrobiales bacterium]|nr:hypothetical protein [Thermomicrobiales bacterium]
MNDTPRYHLSEHDSADLLEPIRAELEKLEQRTRHYRERIPLGSPDDDEALRVASEALASARAAIAEVVRSRADSTRVPAR